MLFLSHGVLLSLADANVNVFCFLLFFKYLGGSGPENCLAVPGLLSTEILIRRRRDQGDAGQERKAAAWSGRGRASSQSRRLRVLWFGCHIEIGRGEDGGIERSSGIPVPSLLTLLSLSLSLCFLFPLSHSVLFPL